MYFPRSSASNEDVAGATSDGFNTTALPAAIAPMTGSSDKTCGRTKLKEKKELGQKQLFISVV